MLRSIIRYREDKMLGANMQRNLLRQFQKKLAPVKRKPITIKPSRIIKKPNSYRLKGAT